MRCHLAAELCIVKKGLKNVVILKIIEIRHLHYSTLTLNDKAIFLQNILHSGQLNIFSTPSYLYSFLTIMPIT